MTESANITKRAKSNLAFTLVDLPEQQRKHMGQLYAFCRIIDDIVDEDGMNSEQRHEALNRWEQLIHFQCEPLQGVESEVCSLVEEINLDTKPMMELISGCRSDIEQKQPATREDLIAYAFKVASCVGISSATVMGASPAARDYAIVLGFALQMVNILRDVAEDYHKYNRIYLPKADMDLFGVSEEDIKERRYSYRVRQLFAYEAALTEKYFCEADEHYAGLSAADRHALIPAQAMSYIYRTIFYKMRDDEFRVFEQRYSINNLSKIWHLLRARLGSFEMPNIANISEWAIFKTKSQGETKP